jgi:hypothetical protein
MHRSVLFLLASGFMVLGVIFVVKPRAAVPDEVSTIDIAALTAVSKNLPAQQWPGF